MNWPKARLWLIITFLCLDVLLAGVLLSDTGLPYRWQRPTSRALTGQLARYGLELQAVLPAAPPRLALQRLERVSVPDWLLPQIYPDGVPVPQATRTATGGTELVYRSEEAVTIMEPGGRVTVYYVAIMPQPEAAGASGMSGALARGRTGAADARAAAGSVALSHEQLTGALLRTAEAWVHDWGGLPDGADEATVAFDPDTGLGHVAWRPAISGLPLYGSQLRLTIVASEAAEFAVGQWERRWFRALGPSGEPRPAVPAQTALLRLAGHLESIGEPGGTITGVSLGYYTGEYQADAWEVPPVWRLDLADGRYYYVNALTGELESD